YYVAFGPCPVRGGGAWSCPIQVGRKDGDYGSRFRVWAAVVSEAQAYANGAHEGLPGGRNYVYSKTGTPPHVPGRADVTARLVTPCCRRGRGPGGPGTCSRRREGTAVLSVA